LTEPVIVEAIAASAARRTTALHLAHSQQRLQQGDVVTRRARAPVNRKVGAKAGGSAALSGCPVAAAFPNKDARTA